MNRRDLFRKAAAAAALPLAGSGQESKPAASAADAAWKPSVLDDHQNRTVIALTDLIIPATDTPGARAANVNRYVDLFLRDGDSQQRDRFLTGLGWLDGYALRKHGHPFLTCGAEPQIAMLTELDSSDDADLATGRQFFRMAKGMTSRIYYSTEIGFKELNKGGVPATFGCRHPAHG